MAKRKSDIFTVVESVANWFEASEYDVGPSEVVKGTANWAEASSDT